jgi:glycerol uptake facilitator-like aquaporin
VSWFLGWGEVAIPGPRGGWLSVYVAGPVAGALVGAGLHELLLRQKNMDEPKEDG